MGSVTVTYTATGLEDIAKSFEDRAKQTRQSRETTKLNSRAWRTLSTEAQIWEDAAHILRQTTILPETDLGGNVRPVATYPIYSKGVPLAADYLDTVERIARRSK